MNDNNSFPPPGNENPGMQAQPSNPQMPPQPDMMPQNQGFQPPMPVGNSSQISGISKLLIGVMVMLGIMILIVPMGLFKIGSPTPCTGDRAKNGECKVIATPSGCTPKRFTLGKYHFIQITGKIFTCSNDLVGYSFYMFVNLIDPGFL